MNTQFHIAPECLGLFEAHGLAEFSAWMRGGPGELVSETALSDVRRLSVGGQEFYLKRRSGEPVLKLLLPLVFGRRPMSGPIRELHLVNALAGEGFAVMEPVAWGESTIAGIPQEGFLVVSSIPGRSFADVYDDGCGANRLAMMNRLGELLGRLHARGFFQHFEIQGSNRNSRRSANDHRPGKWSTMGQALLDPMRDDLPSTDGEADTA
jgi:hypothetical protein